MIGPTYPFRGGIAHYTTLLYEHLKKKHNVRFVSFSRQYPKLIFPGKTDTDPSNVKLKSDGVERTLDSINPFTWITTALKIARSRADMLIIPWWVAFWTPQFLTISVFVKLFSKTKLLFICHNVVEHESSWLKKVCTRLVLGWGDWFIVHSKEDEANLRELLSNPQVKRNFHPTYDIFSATTKPVSREYAKKKIGVEGKKTVLFFGFVRPYKGLEYLIKAFAEIAHGSDITLIIAGEFWKDRQTYFDLIAQLGIEDYIKLVDDYIPNENVPLYFNAADCVVVPYTSATGSGIVQMAYGFNRTVIASDVGCLPEVVKDGKTGYVIKNRNVQQLAKAILKTLTNKKYLEFEENIKEVKKLFSWDKMVAVIESFMKDTPEQ